jgi:predicted dehydrogenase
MKKYKSAIIGCGAVFCTHGVSIRICERAELVAVCDKVKEKADDTAKQYNCRAYTDYIEMLESEDIDVVHICLPHFLHAPVALECMKRGKHVITEKPMAISVGEAQEMIDASKKYGVTLACIFQNRYNPGTQLVRNMYLSGELGRVKGAKCFVTWARSGNYYKKSDWKGTWDKEGGGVIIDQAIHTIDVLRYILNCKAVEVDATIAKRGSEEIEVEDTAEGAILFENGLLANFHAINYYSFDDDIQVDMDFENGRARIISERASVTMFDGRAFSAERDPRDNVDYGNSKSYWGISHSKQISDIYECLETGKEMFVDLEGSFETMKIVCAIYESGKTGKKVKIN